MSKQPHNRNVLLIALETPPARSAGVQRPYRFAEYLLEMGWNPIILTASENVYDRFDRVLQVPPALAERVFRARASDVNKVVSVYGRSPDVLALPDRFWPWYFSAVGMGSDLIKKFNIGAIWSTYPVMTAHLIARSLANKHDLPWVADFRDPMQCHYNPHYKHFNALTRYFERKVITSATRVCTTSKEAAGLYRTLFPAEPADKFRVIENGYVSMDLPAPTVPDKFTLLYSGALYGNGRDINSIFRALRHLKQQGRISAANFVLRFRGSALPGRYAQKLEEHGISELVEFVPAVPFEQAVAEMQQCSANMLIQDEVFRYQIPGKLYDYIQTGKPILAICPVGSATANVCAALPNCWRAWSDAELAAALEGILTQPPIASLAPGEVEQYSRRARTRQLAQLLEEVMAPQQQRKHSGSA